MVLYSSRKISKQKLENKQNSLLQLNWHVLSIFLSIDTEVNGESGLFVIYCNHYGGVKAEILRCLLNILPFLGPHIQFL